ncbi:hypothetical protein B0A52_00506 [Exophiala mesophila]|uniref:Type 1 phosphatases regulator n=1 Tax=Exophiala mesophila TaxID=212818 RepID=A0A438NK86_EXOME|nr:hypothetical protein B0A52_00506 [Exophiala mesophila]
MASSRSSPTPSSQSRTPFSPQNGSRTTGSTRSPMRGQLLAAGSATQTITSSDVSSSHSPSPDRLVLRLRGAHDASTRSPRRQITWAEDVIDNEGLGRKSSKVCCIYHKTREFGESSSEDDSSSDSSNDSDAGGSDSPDDGGARMSGNRRGRKAGHNHGHGHGDDCDHAGDSGGKGKGKSTSKRKPSPNAYEKMPKYSTNKTS